MKYVIKHFNLGLLHISFYKLGKKFSIICELTSGWWKMDDFIAIEISQQLKKWFGVYGVKGTEDTINRVYQNMPELRQRFLEEYKRLLKGE